MRFRPILLLLASLPAAMLAQKVNIEFDSSVDFSQFRTFHINEGQLNAKNPNLNNDLVRKKIQEEIRRRLLEKGLTEAPAGPRDLNVGFRLGAARRRQVDVYPAGWRGRRTRRVVNHYTQGTLTIDLRDPRQRALVWRAVAVEDKNDAAHIEGKLPGMVKKAFEQYPPKNK
jgi:Domain of unknown function (DUF4136)